MGWLLLAGFWLVAMWAAFAFVFPVVFAVTVAVSVLGALSAYFVTAGRVLLPDRGVRAPPEGAEPAYRHYLVSQVWRDWWAVLAGSVPMIDERVRKLLRYLNKLLLKDQRRDRAVPRVAGGGGGSGRGAAAPDGGGPAGHGRLPGDGGGRAAGLAGVRRGAARQSRVSSKIRATTSPPPASRRAAK